MSFFLWKNLWLNDLVSKLTLRNSLFGAVKFTKYADISNFIMDMVLDLMYVELFHW